MVTDICTAAALPLPKSCAPILEVSDLGLCLITPLTTVQDRLLTQCLLLNHPRYPDQWSNLLISNVVILHNLFPRNLSFHDLAELVRKLLPSLAMYFIFVLPMLRSHSDNIMVTLSTV